MRANPVITRQILARREVAAFTIGTMSAAPDDGLVLELTLAEAMTVAAALRQYEPYWSGQADAAAIARQLTELREQITAVLGKLRAAAAS